MKKVTLSAFLCTMAMAMNAEITDISNMDNVVYIEPCSAAIGSEYTLSVKMKNSVVAEGFGFDLVLPDGITVALDGYGDPKAELSTVRTNSSNTNIFNADFKLDGSLNIQAYSTKGRTISGNDGEVALITIQIAAGMQLGTYPIQLKNIAISDANSITYTVDLVETSIEIVSGGGATILDETSTTVPAASSGAVDIKVLRTIKGGVWNTICLPFAMTGTEVTTAFGDDVQLADFVDYEAEDDGGDNVTGITVNFNNVVPTGGMEANYPYLIKTSQDITEFTAHAVIEPDEEGAVVEYDNGKTGSRRQVYGTFYGTFHAQTVVPENCLFISDNQFWYSTGQTKMKAFRGYFEFVDVLADAQSAKISFMVDEVPTSVDGIPVSERVNCGKVYTLSGQLVGKDVQQGQLKEGVYIVNGKKLYVK